MRSGKLNSRPSQGRLNLFFYDPKFKKTLPYYDTFPLVLPLEPIKGGFIGMNFHYLQQCDFTFEKTRWLLTGDTQRNTRIEVSYDTVRTYQWLSNST